MRAALEVPYADAAAADLMLSIETAPRASLVSLRRECPGGSVELHVLGASHQVVLVVDEQRLVEVVACASGEQEHILPGHADREIGGVRHCFSAQVDCLAPDDFAEEAAKLEATLGADPDALVAVFPGEATAITGLRIDRADAAVVQWRSWHAYPQRGEIVTTRTVVQRA